MPFSSVPAPVGSQSGSGRRRGASVKTLKRVLKKAGLKTSGRKAALTRRAKKAHLKVGGGPEEKEVVPPAMGGRRRRGGVDETAKEVVPPMDGARRRSRKH